jgi:hypothetical protein
MKLTKDQLVIKYIQEELNFTDINENNVTVINYNSDNIHVYYNFKYLNIHIIDYLTWIYNETRNT